MISTTATGKFLTGIISRNITLSHDLSLLKANDAQVPPSIRVGFSDLWWHLINRKEHTFSGSIVKDTINATSVARAALNAYFLDLDREDAALASLFKGKDDFALAVAQLIGKYTGLDNWPDLMKD